MSLKFQVKSLLHDDFPLIIETQNLNLQIETAICVNYVPLCCPTVMMKGILDVMFEFRFS